MSEFTPPRNDQGGRNSVPRFGVPGPLAVLYGILRPVRYPGVATLQQEELPEVSFGELAITEDEARSVSHLGTPIYYPILLKGGEYKQYDRNGEVQRVRVGDLRMPLSSVVEMSRSKVLTTTRVVAAQSTVKEIYAHDDWTIRVSGILLDEPQHPQGATTIEAMQERLLEFEALADAIEVEAELLHQRQVYRMVIKSISFNQLPGKPRMHGFQMECVSDDALELIIQ